MEPESQIIEPTRISPLSVVTLLLSLVLLYGIIVVSRAEELVFGLPKQNVFAPLYNAFWVVIPFHVRAFFHTEFFLVNAHKVLFHLIRIQAVILVISVFSITTSLQIGMFVSLVSLLVCSGVVLWGVGKQASRTSAWIAVMGISTYLIFTI